MDGLVQKRLVERLQDDSDRRMVWIQLTADGASRCRQIHRDNDAHCGAVFESIPHWPTAAPSFATSRFSFRRI